MLIRIAGASYMEGLVGTSLIEATPPCSQTSHAPVCTAPLFPSHVGTYSISVLQQLLLYLLLSCFREREGQITC